MGNKPSNRTRPPKRGIGSIHKQPAIDLAQSAFAPGTGTCRITSAHAERNDDDYLDVTVKFEYSNLSSTGWTGTRITAQLFDPLVGVVDESDTFFTAKVEAGATHKALIRFESVDPEFLERADQCTIIVTGYGCTVHAEQLGTAVIANDSSGAGVIRCPIDVADMVRVVSLTVIKSEPDDDRGVLVGVRALLQNLSSTFIPLILVRGEVMSPAGHTLPFGRPGIALGPAEIRRSVNHVFANDYDARKATLSVDVYRAEGAFRAQREGIDGAAVRRLGRKSKRKEQSPDPLEGRRVRIRFPMTKGDGDYPDLSHLPPRQQADDYLVSFLSFNPDFGPAEKDIESWHMVDDGLSQFRKDGYPAPIIDFILKKKISRAKLEDLRTSASTCSYSLRVPGINDSEVDEGYFFEDQNGYTHIVDVW